MKRIAAIALLTLATCVTAAHAANSESTVQANIPFDFVVGERVLPSGTYTIVSLSEGVIRIQNTEQKITVLSLAQADDPSKDKKLVFSRHGDRRFLTEILCSDTMSVQIPTSKLEKMEQKKEAYVQDSGQILVALK